jgi:endoglucanase
MIFILPASALAANESLSIRLNTIGYLPGTEKQAAIAAIGTNFTVLRLADNATGFTGKVTSPALDFDTPEQPCAADFSKLKNPGDHPLAVPGGLSFGK